MPDAGEPGGPPTVEIGRPSGQGELTETDSGAPVESPSKKHSAPEEPPQVTMSAADRATARALASSGMNKLQSGDAAGALADFEAADAIVQVPTVRLMVAKAQLQLGDKTAARRTLESVLKMPQHAHDPVVFQRARDEAGKLLQTLSP